MGMHEVSGLWRYPVKSMGGERLPEARLEQDGVHGDRRWALRDEGRRSITEARKLPALLSLTARYTSADISSPVEITLPDGVSVRSGEAETHRVLSKAVGREVTLWPRLPASQAEHYRRDIPDGDVDQHLLDLFAVESAEQLPDFSTIPEIIYTNQTVPGTYFDWAAIHLLSEASLASLQRLAPASAVDVRRFRPNILIGGENGGGADYPEWEWTGRRVRVGGAVLRVTDRAPRCAMITHPQGDLPKDRELARVVHDQVDHCLGVYAEVEEPGLVRPGDQVQPIM